MKHFDLISMSSYKEIVNRWLEAQPKEGHGVRLKMAKAIGTQTGFISQVLRGGLHFSAEQALEVAQFMGLSPSESKFFIYLLQWERAGTPRAKEFFWNELEKIRSERSNLSKRIEAHPVPSQLDVATYFSTWMNAAVHAAATCPSYESPEKLARALGIPEPRMKETIEFLAKSGLLILEGNKISVGNARMHLGKDSLHLARHHLNWRIKAMQRIEKRVKNDTHYTSVLSLSQKDALRFGEDLIQLIQRSVDISAETDPESPYVLNLDFFELNEPS